MSYATINDVFARYRPISTVVGSGNLKVMSTDVASVFISGAEGIIDGFLATRYVTPVPANPMITQIASDLAIFEILVEKLPQVPDFMQKRYDRCMDLLKMISSGTIAVASAQTLTSGVSDQEAWSSAQGYHSIFSPVLPAEDQRVDENRVDADESQRSSDAPT